MVISLRYFFFKKRKVQLFIQTLHLPHQHIIKWNTKENSPVILILPVMAASTCPCPSATQRFVRWGWRGRGERSRRRPSWRWGRSEAVAMMMTAAVVARDGGSAIGLLEGRSVIPRQGRDRRWSGGQLGQEEGADRMHQQERDISLETMKHPPALVYLMKKKLNMNGIWCKVYAVLALNFSYFLYGKC